MFINAEVGAGTKYLVKASALFNGNDIVIALSGGTHSHIGAVALACYEPVRDSATLSTISVYTHRDDVVAAQFAKNVSSALKCNVSVSAGIHVDDATGEDIALLRGNCDICCAMLIEKLKSISL